mmetsp:Transcript_16095/g.21574  ORF Transcript_16095/g.21574 Transcript_16095/m.21574 type:complete len:501 (-) Transcript_16095:413-1915(-)
MNMLRTSLLSALLAILLSCSASANILANDTCDLCIMFGGTLKEDTYPEYDHMPEEMLPKNLTCAELADIFSSAFPDGSDKMCYDAVIEFHYECCEFETSTSQCEQAVHSSLLGDDSDYSVDVVPLPLNEKQFDVGVGMDYFALTSIDIVAGTAEIFMGILMTWNDERLRWDPNEFGGCFNTLFRASLDLELTNIWVPPFDLFNRDTSLDTLPEAYGIVNSRGDVSWFRFGSVKALCFFQGLERFPFDKLRCQFLFFSTASNIPIKYNILRNLTFHGTGEDASEDEIRRYQEFSIVPEKSGIEGNEDSSLLTCTFVFKRSSRFYVLKIIIPTILFTFLTFGSFLLDQRVGERLGFGVSVLLVIVAQAILTSDILPVTRERLWIDVLTQGSQYFSILAVAESLLVAYLHYIKVEPAEGMEGSSSHKRNDEERESFLENKKEEAPREEEELDSTNDKESLSSRIKNFHWTAEKILVLDSWCLILFPSTYSIFLIVLFASNRNF